MGITEEAVARAVAPHRARAEAEVAALVEAALAVLERSGVDGLTVADVLAQAGLSTRAFYRHFRSKDELVLAIYERDARATTQRLVERLDAAPDPAAAVATWVDETLALAFDPRRARRTRPLAREGLRLRGEHPARFAAILAGVVEPLAAVLRTVPTPDPERDAASIHAVTWAVVEEKLAGGGPTRDEARAHVLRFCLAAVGLAP
ncbi:MAG: TetR family transcriptional regulator [Acidimicrobiia bacterium]|nr:MAG: TetR family transcriptional regulator [Acidimicrobiia bacterium]